MCFVLTGSLLVKMKIATGTALRKRSSRCDFKRAGCNVLRQISQLLRSVKSINDRRRVTMVRRSRCMGGHLTDLINMADCQEWNGQRFKKIM